MNPTVAAITADLDALYPPSLAAQWDNVGLLLGDPAVTVGRILTCLTLTPEVAAEAVEDGFQLVVTHHPILFRGAKRLTSATAEGQTVLALAGHGIAVYSPHTAFDNARGGINDQLAALAGLIDVQPLRRADGPRQYKVVVFVPEVDFAKVSAAMFAAGGGTIGEYRECSFRVGGTGTFFGEAESTPAVGQKGRREEVAEWRLETVCLEGVVDGVIAAARSAHSYEEPAIDVYPLRAEPSSAGAGRVGRLPSPMSLSEFGSKLRAELKCGPIQMVGDPARPIERVALACGAAGEFLTDAIQSGADVFLTGEMRFHDYLAARAAGISLVLPGHYATERFAVEELAVSLSRRWPGLEVRASQRETDPVGWV